MLCVDMYGRAYYAFYFILSCFTLTGTKINVYIRIDHEEITKSVENQIVAYT